MVLSPQSGVNVHELGLLQKAAGEHDWKAIETEVEPEFEDAAVDFRHQKHSFACTLKGELDRDLQAISPFLDGLAGTEVAAQDGNPDGTGSGSPLG